MRCFCLLLLMLWGCTAATEVPDSHAVAETPVVPSATEVLNDSAAPDGRLDCPEDEVGYASVDNYFEGVPGFKTRSQAIDATFDRYRIATDEVYIDDGGYAALVRGGREIVQVAILDSGNGFASVEIAGCQDPVGELLITATPPGVP